MPFEWLEDFRNTELDSNTKWWLIDTAIKQNVSEGLTQTALKDELRYYGFSFGNSEFSTRYQALRDFGEKFDYFGKLPDNRLANDQNLATVSWLDSRYRYIAKYQLENPDTGKLQTYTTAIKSNSRLTPTQSLDLLIDQASSIYKLPPYAIQSMYIAGALFNPDFAEEDIE